MKITEEQPPPPPPKYVLQMSGKELKKVYRELGRLADRAPVLDLLYECARAAVLCDYGKPPLPPPQGGDIDETDGYPTEDDGY